MAIAVVQALVNGIDGNVAMTTGTIAQPAEGNKLYAFIHSFKSNTITAVPDGWTLHEHSVHGTAAGGGIFDVRVYVKTAGPAEPTSYTWTQSSGVDGNVGFVELSSDAGDPDVDADADSGFTNASSQTTGTTAATAENDEFAIAFVGMESGSSPTSPSWTNSFSHQDDNFAQGGTPARSAIATKAIPTPQTVTTTLSWGTATLQAHAYVLVVKQATATEPEFNNDEGRETNTAGDMFSEPEPVFVLTGPTG